MVIVLQNVFNSSLRMVLQLGLRILWLLFDSFGLTKLDTV